MLLKRYSLLLLCYCAVALKAQTNSTEHKAISAKGLTGIPELTMTNISGAPMLTPPMLVTSAKGTIAGQGHGIAAPAFYDMDGDGLKDLLIGEFGSGMEFGRYMGNFIRVYSNTGDDNNPKFEGRFTYARPPFRYQVQAHGTPYSVDQYCCMGFTPQFIDLDQDGYDDMITGHYQGEVSWFRGSEDGFYPGEALPQEGNPRGSDWVKNQRYWLYSSASFGDFTGDGLPDLITGGKSLRISKNIGDKNLPQFSKRDYLLDVNGNPLNIYNYTPAEVEYFRRMEEDVPIGGDIDLSPVVIDWDNDGVLDLLVTNSYAHSGLAPIHFFRGVKQGDGYNFHPAIPLFTAKDGSKELPGSVPRLAVTDWNSDGINDLLIGASVATTNNQFNDNLSWRWEHDAGILAAGKDPANLNEDSLTPDQLKRYKEYATLPQGISMDEYMTLRHKGYVFVMLGKAKPPTKPTKKK